MNIRCRFYKILLFGENYDKNEKISDKKRTLNDSKFLVKLKREKNGEKQGYFVNSNEGKIFGSF